MYHSLGKPFLATLSLIFLTSIGLSGCGGGNVSSSQPDTSSQSTSPPIVERDWWDVDAPDYTQTPQRPSITLEGMPVVRLQAGETYKEAGISAVDAEDGDLSGQVSVSGTVNTDEVGDYFLRYSVTDSDGNVAIDKTRMVRVLGEEPVDYSLRPLGDFQVNMGYVEYVPADYGEDPDKKYPLLIYHHGNGANAEFAEGEEGALENVLVNFGPPTLQRAGRWDRELPFIVLTPHAGFIEGSPPAQRVDIFMQHALLTYNIDTTRIYMMGWSQGGGVTMNYARNFPEKLAATISISAGTPPLDNVPDDFYNSEEVPLWAFHGGIDGLVPVDYSIRLYDWLNANCQPTVLPKLTLFPVQGHNIHHFTADLSAMEGGRFEYEVDDNYDPFNMSIYDWLLSFTNERD